VAVLTPERRQGAVLKLTPSGRERRRFRLATEVLGYEVGPERFTGELEPVVLLVQELEGERVVDGLGRMTSELLAAQAESAALEQL
jgi:hypothetical protein